jgi:hypothetical protein
MKPDNLIVAARPGEEILVLTIDKEENRVASEGHLVIAWSIEVSSGRFHGSVASARSAFPREA